MQFEKMKMQEILRENEKLKRDLADAHENIAAAKADLAAANAELAIANADLSVVRARLHVAERDREATVKLYDMMVTGTRNLLILTDGGSRKAVYVSPNVEDVLGLPREMVMNDIRELGPASGELPGKELFASVGENEHLVRSDVECIDRRTGQPRAYHRSVTRIEGVEGVERYLTVYLDAESGTADNSRLHEILYEGVIAANSRMLKGMSHDLRTPLNSIAGFVMLLMKNADNADKVQDYAHRIGMSCQDLLVMINQILDISDSQKKGQEAFNREFALGKTIEEITDLIRNKAQLKHQTFEVRTDGIEHDIFIGDKAKVVEVLMNLLNNAVQYTPEGGRIMLSVIGRQDGDPGYRNISFEVSDNGIGMSSELQKRLFDITGSPSPSAEMKGSGVGIAITRKLVAQMGGTISVQSTLGQGTTFFVGLRLQTAGHTVDSFWSEHGIRRVLVAGENMNEAARIRELLVNTGLDTEYTSSGYGVLQLIADANADDNGFDLLLIDRDIQDKGYMEIAEEIRERIGGKIPATILMSDKAEHFTQNVHKTGIAAIMPKPFFFSTFRDIVEELGPLAVSGADDMDASGINPLAGLRFLAAEDNAINADVLKELLEVEGAKCEIAGNGKAAVVMFKNSRPGYYDMILMDIRMPLMDGYAATAEIRKLMRDDANLPILAMTADTAEEDVERSYACGMDAHIPKPLNIKLLNREVYRLRSKK